MPRRVRTIARPMAPPSLSFPSPAGLLLAPRASRQPPALVRRLGAVRQAPRPLSALNQGSSPTRWRWRYARVPPRAGQANPLPACSSRSERPSNPSDTYSPRAAPRPSRLSSCTRLRRPPRRLDPMPNRIPRRATRNLTRCGASARRRPVSSSRSQRADGLETEKERALPRQCCPPATPQPEPSLSPRPPRRPGVPGWSRVRSDPF